jgi:hypothetical protein
MRANRCRRSGVKGYNHSHIGAPGFSVPRSGLPSIDRTVANGSKATFHASRDARFAMTCPRLRGRCLSRSNERQTTGWVAEWSKAAVLKTAEGASPPGVRIPPHPPLSTLVRCGKTRLVPQLGRQRSRSFRCNPVQRGTSVRGGTAPFSAAIDRYDQVPWRSTQRMDR